MFLGLCSLSDPTLLKAKQGALVFMETGVPRERLVLVLLWYGYNNP